MNDTFKVGDRVHYKAGTDTYPGTVVKVTKTFILVREDKFQPDPDWQMDFRGGGFVGHVVNNGSQQQIIAEDLDGRTRKFTKRGPKNLGLGKTLTRWIPTGLKWTDNAHLRPEWKAFYDYNF